MSLRLACLFSLLPLAASAAEGAAWLKIPQGARSVALGTAVSALHGGAEGQWYTPAALAHVHAPELTFSRQAWLGQTRDDYLGAVMPAGSGALGVYANFLGTDDVVRDAFGNEGAAFSNSAWAIGLGYGYRAAWFSAGLAAKMLQERFAATQAAGYAGDLGVQIQLGAPWLRLGGAVQNMGSLSGYSPGLGSVELPLTYRGGLALDQALPGVLMSVEARVLPLSRESSVLAGLEWSRHFGLWGVALRGGYEAAAAQAGDLAGMAVGAGLRLQNLKVDFTYTPYGGLGDPYRMTLGWDFGGASAQPVAAKPAVDVEDRAAQVKTLDAQFRSHYSQGRKAETMAALEARLALQDDPALRAWLERYRQAP